jgi:plasmid stability protein
MATTATTRKSGVTVLHIRNFPDDLHRDLKVEAAMSSQPLLAVVEEAVRRELDRRRRDRERREARGRGTDR